MIQKELQLHPDMQLQDQQLDIANTYVTQERLKNLLDKNGYILQDFSFNKNSAGTINSIYNIKAYNKNHCVSQKDENNLIELILRISNTHNFWQNIKTEHEVSILKLINQFKENPNNHLHVPNVIDYNIQQQFIEENNQELIVPEFILMDKIPGILLSQFITQYWENSPNKIEIAKSILEQGYTFLQQLKQLPLKKDKICGFNSKYEQIKINWDGPSIGPFENLKDFFIANIDWSVQQFQDLNQKEQYYQEFIEFLQNLKNQIINNKFNTDFQVEFEFCHNDLHPGNILIDPETLVITGYLDWEHSKIFPSVSDQIEYDLIDPWFNDLKDNKEMQEFQQQQLIEKNIIQPNQNYQNLSEKEKLNYKIFCIIMQANWINFYVANWWLGEETEKKIIGMKKQRVYAMEDFISTIKKYEMWPEYTFEKTQQIIQQLKIKLDIQDQED